MTTYDSSSWFYIQRRRASIFLLELSSYLTHEDQFTCVSLEKFHLRERLKGDHLSLV